MSENTILKKKSIMKSKKKINISRYIIYTILVVWAITTIFPFVWVIINSFKPSSELLTSSFSLPKEFTLDNYKNAFDNLNILRAYGMSFFISGSVTIGVIILASMMSFALTRYNFKGKWVLDAILIASLMFPVFSTIIPVYQMMIKWELLNTPIAVILPQIASNLSFATIVMMGFMRAIPLEIEESAYIEGANVFTVFTRIIVPISKPAISTVAIFSFLWSYNDLFVQTTMIGRRVNYPVCALLNEISSKYGTDYGLMAASVAIILVPVFIIYLLLQKNIIKGLTAGAVKG
ncbi:MULTISPECIES: carbohydrate ABC transporter permease [unclassified Clostridium]|uniref:carbohydrate ABC transporter permease n=1 Tax=Clostridium TaxID=1485 RepID=UPI0021AB1BB6|nr:MULTISPECIES: carbohydrate ABC transporter permease [unclassified Clostridium]MDU2290749.1 carbohydrate ABC transporter permease [Clostridium celatum]